jgi:hypothetical protein
VSQRAEALADRILACAQELAEFAEGIDKKGWSAKIPGDGRLVGVVVHHVASVYPLEVQLARTVASGEAIKGVTWGVIAEMNARHASENAGVQKAEALRLLRENSAAAAAEVRRFSDEELDSSAPISLYADAPLTAQFFIEDHALRHSLHHLAKIREAVAQTA